MKIAVIQASSQKELKKLGGWKNGIYSVKNDAGA